MDIIKTISKWCSRLYKSDAPRRWLWTSLSHYRQFYSSLSLALAWGYAWLEKSIILSKTIGRNWRLRCTRLVRSCVLTIGACRLKSKTRPSKTSRPKKERSSATTWIDGVALFALLLRTLKTKLHTLNQKRRRLLSRCVCRTSETCAKRWVTS